MDCFPTGIIAFGDAVVSFNPTYGQGMTMTSIQAGNLRTVLRFADPDIAGRLSRATAKTTWPVWAMTTIGDLSLHNATGDARWWYKPVGGLFDQFLGAAETDPVLAECFCGASACSTVSTWSPRCGWSGARSDTTWVYCSPRRSLTGAHYATETQSSADDRDRGHHGTDGNAALARNAVTSSTR